MATVQVTPAGLQVRPNVQRPARQATSLALMPRVSQMLAKHSPRAQEGAALPLGMDKQLQQSLMSWQSFSVVHSGYPPDDPPAPPVLVPPVPPVVLPPVTGLPPVAVPPEPAPAAPPVPVEPPPPVLPPVPPHGPSKFLDTPAAWR